jgi:CheY-like chemotaxis protein
MPQILVVDDSRYSRRVIGDTLRTAGYEVIEAADGEQGLALAEMLHPDCVLVDLRLKGIDGQNFLRQKNRLGLDVPVIVTAADAEPQVRHDCETLGAFDVLAKPIDPDALIASVEQSLILIEETFE